MKTHLALRHAGTGTTLPTSGTAALYYHRNQQYSIVGLSDAAGTLVERYAYTAYGELTILAPNRTARATSSFQNRYTYTGREWDPTLRLYYFRARWLEPKAGRFIGRDPLGYVDGMGLYQIYTRLNRIDPSGLRWKRIDEKLFEADDPVNDSLQSLAIQITGNVNDWVCIWPLSRELQISKKGYFNLTNRQNKCTVNAWALYPDALQGNRADVSNLIETEGKKLEMMPANFGDKYLKVVSKMFNDDTTINADEMKWKSGSHAGQILMEESGQGKTPISYLGIGGHSGPGLRTISALAADGRSISNEFEAADLFRESGWQSNSHNNYETAVQKKGPPRCWFTKNSNVYGLGCKTEDWANDWANQVLRQGATAHGTTEWLFGNFAQRGQKSPLLWFSSTFPENNPIEGAGKEATNLDEAYNLPKGWMKIGGTQ